MYVSSPSFSSVSRPIVLVSCLLRSSFFVSRFYYKNLIKNRKMHQWVHYLILLYSISVITTQSFSHFPRFNRSQKFMISSSHSPSQQDLPEPAAMNIKDMQHELQNMGVSYSDCFDRPSIVDRLLTARRQQNTDSLSRLRSLSVKELRTECSKQGIRWANMIEKDELVQALLQHEKNRKERIFSITGQLVPGIVADISGETLAQELATQKNMVPLLLDVYATWCGPCQLMATQLKQVAHELGSSIRVAKIDSDKYSDWASRLGVHGLPTLIVFHGDTGKELERIEGAMMKDSLLQVLKKYIYNRY